MGVTHYKISTNPVAVLTYPGLPATDYSTSKTSGFKKYKNYESNSGYVNNLTSGKTYYFKVRTYIKTDSGYVYSPFSAVKGVKVK